MSTYATKGDVRGDCGHRHRSLDAAIACLEADQRGCESQGGYSDRWVYCDGRPVDKIWDDVAECYVYEEDGA